MANIPFLNNAYFSAKVGIGTDSPDSQLEVYYDSAGNTGAQIKLGSGDVGYETTITNYRRTTDSTFEIASYDDTILGYNRSTDKTWLGIGTNVGIGTTSPSEKLQVEGKVYIQGSGQDWNETTPGITRGSIHFDPGTTTADTGNALTFGASDTPGSPSEGSTAQAGIYTRSDGNYGTKMYLATTDDYSSGSKTRMMIDYNGNVGVGTINPGYKLSVDDDTVTTVPKTLLQFDAGSIADNGGYNIDFRVSSNNTADRFVSRIRGIRESTGALSQLSFWTESGSALEQRMTIRASGKVGIGTTTPGEKLHVNGNVLITSALLSNQENTDVDTGAEVVAQVAHATYTAAFFDFVVKKGTNVRSGTVYACHNGDTTPLVEFTETSTNDLGDTSDVTLSVDISGTNMRLLATVTSDDWSVKSLIRAI